MSSGSFDVVQRLKGDSIRLNGENIFTCFQEIKLRVVWAVFDGKTGTCNPTLFYGRAGTNCLMLKWKQKRSTADCEWETATKLALHELLAAQLRELSVVFWKAHRTRCAV
jgi:hypothetical protein